MKLSRPFLSHWLWFFVTQVMRTSMEAKPIIHFCQNDIYYRVSTKKFILALLTGKLNWTFFVDTLYIYRKLGLTATFINIHSSSVAVITSLLSHCVFRTWTKMNTDKCTGLCLQTIMFNDHKYEGVGGQRSWEELFQCPGHSVWSRQHFCRFIDKLHCTVLMFIRVFKLHSFDYASPVMRE